ncbi:MAG: VOC family protein [Anaerolineae bacterium]
MREYKLDPGTRVGGVHLTVSDAPRALRFYRDVLGFTARQDEGGALALGASESDAVIWLTESPDARPKPSRTTGLYHFAIPVPSRPDLAHVLQRLREHAYPLQGASDHGVSEALYLADPDGNGIEIYRDRPWEAWPREGDTLQMTTAPLDVQGSLKPLEASVPQSAMPTGTDIGHVHLHVADLAATERFYCDVLGMDVIQRYGDSALFFSAGGYHHHVGANVWAGRGAPPPPDDAVGLRYYTLRLPDDEALGRFLAHLHAIEADGEEREGGVRLVDPSGNVVWITSTLSLWDRRCVIPSH